MWRLRSAIILDGKDARGQIVAIAKLLPSGVGKIIDAAKKHTLFSIRRQLTAHDYVDGAPNKHKKSFGDWLDDTLLAMRFSAPSPTTNSMIPTARLIFHGNANADT